MNLKQAMQQAVAVLRERAIGLAELVDGDWEGAENLKAEHDHLHNIATELERHAAIEYVAVQPVDMDRTSEHLVTDDLRAAIKASGK